MPRREVSGDWTYTVTDNEATITNYSGSATEIAVPTALEGIPVVKLGEDWPPVFYKNDRSLPITKVTIPEHGNDWRLYFLQRPIN